MVKTTTEFNQKWANYLEDRHYGMSLIQLPVLKYLNDEFEKEVKVNPDFSYSQIKSKFGQCRIYANSTKVSEWQTEINNIMKLEV